MPYFAAPLVFLVFSNAIGGSFAAVSGCITGVNLYAGTGSIDQAGSDGDFQLVFHYRGDDKKKYTLPILLYNLGGDDQNKNRGDFWLLDGPERCAIEPSATNTIKTVNGRDGWYIESAIVYGEMDDNKQDLFLISHNYQVNSWVDDKFLPPDNVVSLPIDHIENDKCVAKDQCIKNFYIMANTACGDPGYGSDGRVDFVINEHQFQLSNLAGDDMSSCKSDLWKVSASDAGIKECLKFGDVTKAAFHSQTSDGWRVADAIVTVQLDSTDYALLAGNRELNKWVDDDDYVDLTLKNKCVADSTMQKNSKCMQ